MKSRSEPCATPARSDDCSAEKKGLSAMAPQAWVTLAIGALIVGMTAVALIRIIAHLIHVRQTLRAVVVGVLAIVRQTQPVGPAIEQVNASLKPVRDFAESI